MDAHHLEKKTDTSMPWIILRFVLVGPAVGCYAFILLGLLMPGGNAAAVAPIVPSFFDSVKVSALVSLYAMVFTYPLTGPMAAMGGAAYWWILNRNSMIVHRWQRVLVGCALGIVGGAAMGALVINWDGAADMWRLGHWAAAGAVSGACCGMR